MLASIDLGTNSARLLIGRVEDNRVISIRQHRIITRMGQGLKETGNIEPQALARTVRALKEFYRLISQEGVTDTVIIATSAARRASNGEELAREVYRIFGKELRILNGREEAMLSYQGALTVLPGELCDGMPVVIDIGGGSTEICFEAGARLQALSLELGAVRCTENPISDRELKQKLMPLVEMLAGYPASVLIGVGGTVTTLAAMDQQLVIYDSGRINGYTLGRDQVAKWLKLLETLTLPERQSLPGLEPGRADIIMAGTKILLSIMDSLKAQQLIASEADLLHGALLELSLLQR